jgi:hypothetical protein
MPDGLEIQAAGYFICFLLRQLSTAQLAELGAELLKFRAT